MLEKRSVLLDRRKIRLIERYAKCRHLKKLTVTAGVYLFEAQNPIPSSLHTVYVYAVYLFSYGKGGGGELNQREG
jgi:hypothetical protein